MPYAPINGTSLYYEDHGTGNETIVFSHGFLFNTTMFENQVDALKSEFRIITYDHRGQGKSEVAEGGYNIENQVEDAKQLLDFLKLKQVNFAGLSMGGFVGLRLAAWHPEYVKRLILINTSAQRAKGYKLIKYRVMKRIIRLTSYNLLKGEIMKALFGKTFLKDKERLSEKKKWTEHIKSLQKPGLIRSFETAIDRPPFVDFEKITCPTLIIGGKEDIGLSPEESEHIHHNIEGSKLILLEKTGHSSTIENPQEVNSQIKSFMSLN